MIEVLFRRVKDIVVSQRVSRDVLRDPEPPTLFEVSKALFRTQSRYIGWHVVFLAVHFAELLVLALVHRIYFPPESLLLLRVCSTVALIAVIASFSTRLAAGALARQESQDDLQATRISRLLFQATLGLVLALAVGVLLTREAHFESPPIFRALVFSIFLTLPFDSMMNFVFLNQHSFSHLIHRRRLRLLMLFGDMLSLLCVYYDLPLWCVLARSLPRVWAGLGVWRDVSGQNSGALLEFRLFVDAAERAAGRYLLQCTGPAVACAGIMEVSLYWSLSLLKSGRDGAALLVFCSHKIVHLGHVVCLRLGLRQSNLFDPYDLRLASTSIWRSLRRWGVVGATGVLVALLFSPMLLLQKEVVLWSSHIGEPFRWSTLTGVAVLVFTVVRVCAHAITTLMGLRLRSWSHCLPLILWAGGAGLVLEWISSFPFWGGHQDLDRTLGVLAITDALLNLVFLAGMTFLLLRALRQYHARLALGSRFSFIETLVQDLRCPSSALALAYVRSIGRWRHDIGSALALALRAGIRPLAVFSMKGKQELVFLERPTEISDAAIRREMAACLGGNLQELRIVKGQDYGWGQLFRGAPAPLAVAEWFSALTRQSRSLRELSSDRAGRVELVTEALMNGSLDCVVDDSGAALAIIARKSSGWNLLHIQDRQLRGEFARYGKALVKHDLILEPTPLWAGRFGGFLHVIEGRSVVCIAWLTPLARDLKPYLEDWALTRNFTTALASYGLGETVSAQPTTLAWGNDG